MLQLRLSHNLSFYTKALSITRKHTLAYNNLSSYCSVWRQALISSDHVSTIYCSFRLHISFKHITVTVEYFRRTYQDILELVEESLDLTLSGNLVRYRFQDTPILPKVTVHESHGSVVVLVATVASVHRLVFPHPNQLTRQVIMKICHVFIFTGNSV